jgi:Protein of unknown function (DUF3667)
MTESRKECKNCHTFFEGNYCNNCGQEGDEKRFKLSNITETFIHGFYHVHGGLLFTMKELFIRPGEMLRGYISGKRVVYLNPFTYLVLVCLVGGFVYKWSGIPEHVNEILLASGETIKFTAKHLSYRVLLTIPTYALMSSFVYKSFNYNYAEHLIISTFLMSQSMVFMIMGMLLGSFLKPDELVFEILYYGSFLSIIIFQIVVLFRLFNEGNVTMRWLKASIAAISGLGLSFILMDYIVRFIVFFQAL